MFDILDILGISQILEWGKEKLGLKEPEIEVNQIIPVKYNFRPQNLEEYIGVC